MNESGQDMYEAYRASLRLPQRRALFRGGPLDGTSKEIKEGDVYRHTDKNGDTHVYRHSGLVSISNPNTTLWDWKRADTQWTRDTEAKLAALDKRIAEAE